MWLVFGELKMKVITLYRNGKTCRAEQDQVDLMCRAGWNKSKPLPAPTVVEKVEETKTETVTPKTTVQAAKAAMVNKTVAAK